MRSRIASCLWCLGGVLLIQAVALAQPSPLTKEDRALFLWFDRLGYMPEVAGKPLVLVQTGRWSQDANGRYIEREPGVLLRQSGDRFTVFMLSVSTRTFVRRVAEGPNEAVDFANLDLRATAEAVRAVSTSPWVEVGGMVLRDVEVFTLARLCQVAGMDGLAHDLVGSAARLSDGKVREEVGDWIALEQLVRVFAELERGASRVDVRGGLKRLVSNFPNTEHAPFVRETIRNLDRMIPEDRAAPKLEAPLVGDARVARLVFDLRDQTGYQFSNPGSVSFLSCSPFSGCPDLATLSPSPARDLALLGPTAVPALIEALGDSRLTRAVYRRNGIPRAVETIGDCALEILERIAGQRFREYTPDHTLDIKGTRARARAWWATVAKK